MTVASDTFCMSFLIQQLKSEVHLPAFETGCRKASSFRYNIRVSFVELVSRDLAFWDNESLKFH